MLPAVGGTHVALCLWLLVRPPVVAPHDWMGFDAVARAVLPGVSVLFFVFADPANPRSASTREVREARTAADILGYQIPGLTNAQGVVGKNDGLIVLRGVSSINLSSEPAVFLDGVRLGGGLGDAMDALSKIPAEHVRAIRVLRGPAAAFVQGSANGAIFVETRVGPEETR